MVKIQLNKTYCDSLLEDPAHNGRMDRDKRNNLQMKEVHNCFSNEDKPSTRVGTTSA